MNSNEWRYASEVFVTGPLFEAWDTADRRAKDLADYGYETKIERTTWPDDEYGPTRSFVVYYRPKQ